MSNEDDQVAYSAALAHEMEQLGADDVTKELVLDALASTGYVLRESPGEATEAYHRLVREENERTGRWLR